MDKVEELTEEQKLELANDLKAQLESSSVFLNKGGELFSLMVAMFMTLTFANYIGGHFNRFTTTAGKVGLVTIPLMWLLYFHFRKGRKEDKERKAEADRRTNAIEKRQVYILTTSQAIITFMLDEATSVDGPKDVAGNPVTLHQHIERCRSTLETALQTNPNVTLAPLAKALGITILTKETPPPPTHPPTPTSIDI